MSAEEIQLEIASRAERGMLGLDLAPASSAETDLNLARVVGETVTQTEQNRECSA